MARGYRFGKFWRLLHNELETGPAEQYDACKFEEYAREKHPLFAYEPARTTPQARGNRDGPWSGRDGA